MPVSRFNRLRPGQMPSAEDWNTLVDALEQLDRVNGTAGSGVGIARGAGGITVLDGRTGGHWAKVTSRGTGNHYAHHEVIPDGAGGWIDPGVGADGFAWGTATAADAREANGRTDFDADLPLYVWLTPDETEATPGFVFVAPAAGGGGGDPPLAGKRDGNHGYRQTTDGTTTTEYSPQTDLPANTAGNTVVPRPTGVSTSPTLPDGTVLLYVPVPDASGRYWVMPFHPATETYPGWVSVDSQSFAGDKTFTDSVNLGFRTGGGATVMLGDEGMELAGVTAHTTGGMALYTDGSPGLLLAPTNLGAGTPTIEAYDSYPGPGSHGYTVAGTGFTCSYEQAPGVSAAMTVGPWVDTVPSPDVTVIGFDPVGAWVAANGFAISTGGIGSVDYYGVTSAGGGIPDTLGLQFGGGILTAEAAPTLPGAGDYVLTAGDGTPANQWTGPGWSGTQGWTDADGNVHSVTVLRGVVTDWTVTPPGP